MKLSLHCPLGAAPGATADSGARGGPAQVALWWRDGSSLLSRGSPSPSFTRSVSFQPGELSWDPVPQLAAFASEPRNLSWRKSPFPHQCSPFFFLLSSQGPTPSHSSRGLALFLKWLQNQLRITPRRELRLQGSPARGAHSHPSLDPGWGAAPAIAFRWASQEWRNFSLWRERLCKPCALFKEALWVARHSLEEEAGEAAKSC